MENFLQKDQFKVLKEHEELTTGFISSTTINKNALFQSENVSLFDFKQGDIGNCGLIAALATISQRPELSTEIAPRIEHTIKGI